AQRHGSRRLQAGVDAHHSRRFGTLFLHRTVRVAAAGPAIALAAVVRRADLAVTRAGRGRADPGRARADLAFDLARPRRLLRPAAGWGRTGSFGRETPPGWSVPLRPPSADALFARAVVGAANLVAGPGPAGRWVDSVHPGRYPPGGA